VMSTPRMPRQPSVPKAIGLACSGRGAEAMAAAVMGAWVR